MIRFFQYCKEVFFAIKPVISAGKYFLLPGSVVVVGLTAFKRQIVTRFPEAANWLPPQEVLWLIVVFVLFGIIFWGGYSVWNATSSKLIGVDCSIEVQPVKRDSVYVARFERKIVIDIHLTVKNLTEADVVISAVKLQHSLDSLNAGGGVLKVRHIASNGFGKDVSALPKTLKPKAIEVFYLNFECNIVGCSDEDLLQKIEAFWDCEFLGFIDVHKKDLTGQDRVTLDAKKVIDEYSMIS